MLQASSGRRPSRTPRFSWNPAWALALALALACGSPEPPKAPPPVVEAFPSPPPQNTLASAPVPPILLQGVGFSSPDGALYDPTADVYLVSNVAGSADWNKRGAAFQAGCSKNRSAMGLYALCCCERLMICSGHTLVDEREVMRGVTAKFP